MPREIALAVRGPGYHAPFDPCPPPVATAPVDPVQVRKAGEHAALAACESIRRLVSLLDTTPLATVQTGGVGHRELRRAARHLATDVTAVRLWLETGAAAGLVALAQNEWPPKLRRGRTPPLKVALATTEVDRWLAEEPADAFAQLLLAWWHLPLVPSLRLDESGRPASALVRAYGHPEHSRMRAHVLGELATLGEGRGITEPEALLERLAYRAPITHPRPDDTDELHATLTEAELLGLVSTGALTPIGHHLLAAIRTDDPSATLRHALRGTLPRRSHTATFLPDLTAIVTGTAAPDVARLLDATAEVESRDRASVWRFTTQSVRKALDSGHTAERLLAELAAAAGRPIPQPLEYLVRDVARQREAIQVLAVACCIRVADAALAAELAAHRALAPLRLRLLADTVLASELGDVETLDALRSAGYTPSRQDAGGAVVVERAMVRRAEPGPQAASQHAYDATVDVAALAARLVGFA
jgi:Helicase conserved C-terminal domain